VRRYLSRIATIAEFEFRKIMHDSMQVWLRLVQPVLWLVLYGEVMSKIHAIPTEGYTYLQFLTPGILAQSVLFVAIFYGLTVVWERDLGILNKLLSTPTPRSAIVMGKALSAGIRGILQAVAILVIALILGVHLSFNPLNLLGVFVVIILLGVCFASLSMFLASLFKTRERVLGIGQAVTMPLFFASNAIYPTSLMPGWLRVIALMNPLSYAVDLLRSLLLTGDYSQLVLDFAVITFAALLLVTLASRGFSRIIS
jgi:ABC-2 type transport system permease protein